MTRLRSDFPFRPGDRKSIYAKYFDANRLGGDVTPRDGRFIETGFNVLGQFYSTLSISPHALKYTRLDTGIAVKCEKKSSVNTTPLGDNGKLIRRY